MRDCFGCIVRCIILWRQQPVGACYQGLVHPTLRACSGRVISFCGCMPSAKPVAGGFLYSCALINLTAWCALCMQVV